ncbi:zinc ribbon domain-containing protein, partial [Streptomyces sp. PA03-6a]|nr:zinc ribbon domain-containing protein [Streptomyces sp. PA03-6a]
MARSRKPVVTGWFTHDTADEDGFRLLGTRCRGCGAVFFPREDHACRNPACDGAEGDLEEVPLSRRGRVWSYTDARYRPPAPAPRAPARHGEPTPQAA